jgi:hypothetical protein
MKPTAGWYPLKLAQQADGEITLTWQDLTAANFATPFFEDSVSRARYHRPERRQTFLQELGEISLPPAVPSTAFIFHTSRSGSTLLAQLLSCLDGSIALSEPPIIDEILQLHRSDEEKIALLRQVVRALGQARSAADRHFFIKHDSWNLPWQPLIRQAFPAVPCFLIYRNPLEILWSHHRQRGSQMVPGLRDLALLNIPPDSFHLADLDAFTTRVLESIFTQALHHIQQGNLIQLEHHQLVERIEMDVIERLGIVPSAFEKDRLYHRSRFHSKRARDTYQPEDEEMIPLEIRQRLEELVAPVLMPIYEKLKIATTSL